LKLKKRNIISAILLLVVYLIVLWGRSQGLITQFHEVTIVTMGVNMILAVSLNLIVGFTGQLHLGHAGFMAVGAYVAGVMTMKLGQPLILAVLLGAVAAAIAGILIGIPTLRLRGDYLAIATLGFGEIIKGILVNIEYVGGAAGLIGIPQLTNWTWLFAMIVLTVVLINNFINSTHGRACISVRENEIAAEAMGINTTGYKVLAFSMGAFFAGIAGALYAHYFFLIQPNSFTFLKSFDALVIVVLGGLGSITGSIIAALGVTGLNTLLQDLGALRMVIYSGLLVIVMVFRPKGLMGTKEFTFEMFMPKGGDKHERVKGK